MIDPDAHPALIGGKVVDPVGGYLAQFLVREVLRSDPARLTARFPLPARSPVISYFYCIGPMHGGTCFLEITCDFCYFCQLRTMARSKRRPETAGSPGKSEVLV